MDEFLRSTDVIDWQHPAVRAKAEALRAGPPDAEAIARRCFEWVRDEIQHTTDFGLEVVTCAASDVLEQGSGFCYAKSHLLAALLRANGIPAGLCYQRLSVGTSGAPYCLHGLNAVYLKDFGWYRIDARGNKPGIDARFDPPVEHLAFAIREREERMLPEIWAEPLNVVVDALERYATWDQVLANLPDVELFIHQ